MIRIQIIEYSVNEKIYVARDEWASINPHEVTALVKTSWNRAKLFMRGGLIFTIDADQAVTQTLEQKINDALAHD